MLESNPAEDATPQHNYNQLLNGSFLASKSNDGTNAQNTGPVVNPFATMSVHGTPRNDEPYDMMNGMGRPQTHQGHLQNDIFENALKLVGQDGKRPLKKVPTLNLPQRSDYKDQLKEINDYLREQEDIPNQITPFNLNDGR